MSINTVERLNVRAAQMPPRLQDLGMSDTMTAADTLPEEDHALPSSGSTALGHRDMLSSNFAGIAANQDKIAGNADALAANKALLEANTRLLKANAELLESNHALLGRIAARLGVA